MNMNDYVNVENFPLRSTVELYIRRIPIGWRINEY